MCTIANIPQELVSSLNELSKQEHISRAEITRQAVSAYIKHKQKGSVDDDYGLWKERNIDGVSYQNNLRNEWDT